MYIILCKLCENEFEAKTKEARYCCICRNKVRFNKKAAKIKTHICQRCNKEFLPKKNKVKYCNSCQGKTGNISYTFKTANCSYCNKEFTRRTGDINRAIRKGRRLFCSKECNKVGLGGHKFLKCFECGKTFKRHLSDIKTKRNINFCNKDCQNNNLEYVFRGANHYNFIDGQFSEKRGKGWKAIRKKIRERDNNTCQHCNITREELKKELDVHHIIPFREFACSEEANKFDNLIALCSSCHHKEEQRLVRERNKDSFNKNTS